MTLGNLVNKLIFSTRYVFTQIYLRIYFLLETIFNNLLSVGNTNSQYSKVVFKTKRCVNCSTKGDARLLGPFCHMESTLLHPGNIENFHPGKNEKYHPSNHYVIEHDGR